MSSNVLFRVWDKLFICLLVVMAVEIVVKSVPSSVGSYSYVGGGLSHMCAEGFHFIVVCVFVTLSSS